MVNQPVALLQNHPHCTLADLGGKLRRLVHGSIFSKVGASSKPGAVHQGGHDIPEAVIRRRFVSGAKNFQRHYKHCVNSWALYDNSGSQPVMIEWGENT
jgi:hypothetical protein